MLPNKQKNQTKVDPDLRGSAHNQHVAWNVLRHVCVLHIKGSNCPYSNLCKPEGWSSFESTAFVKVREVYVKTDVKLGLVAIIIRGASKSRKLSVKSREVSVKLRQRIGAVWGHLWLRGWFSGLNEAPHEAVTRSFFEPSEKPALREVPWSHREDRREVASFGHEKSKE